MLSVGPGIIRVVNYSAKDPFLTVENVLEPVNSDKAGRNIQLLAQNKLMQSHLNELYELDNSYASLLPDTTRKNELSMLNAKITASEASFKIRLDSISQQELVFSSSDDELFFADIIDAFKQALQNRRSMETLRNTFNNEDVLLSPAKASFLKLKNELNVRESRIEKLEFELEKNPNELAIVRLPV